MAGPPLLRVLPLMAALLLGLGSRAVAQRGTPLSGAETRGDWQFEVAAGYGRGINLIGSTNLATVRLAGVSSRAARAVATFRHDRWLEGELELLAELPVLVGLDPRHGYAAGLLLGGRYRLSPGQRSSVFLAGAAGIIQLALDNPDQPDGLSFNLQSDAGWQLVLTHDWLAILELGLHHISNAGLREANPGINDVRLTFGLGRRLRARIR
jgi:hypothetical protein